MLATDPVKLVKDLLSASWNPTNTDGVTPIFKESDDTEEQKGGDLVRVYSGRPTMRMRMGIRGDFAKYETSVTVDIITYGTSAVKPKAHAVKMREEVERIINANRTNPDAYWEWAWTETHGSVESEYSRFHRVLMDVVLRRWGASP